MAGTNSSKKLSGWVQKILLAVLVPFIIGLAGWGMGYGALNERVTRLRLDVDKATTEFETRVEWGVEQMMQRDQDLTEIKVSLAQIQVQQQEVQKDLVEIRAVLMRIQNKLDEGG